NLPASPPNGPRISCGDFLTGRYVTYLRPGAPGSCMRLIGNPGPRTTTPPTRRPPADPFKPFPHDQRYHTQASDRVSPPPTPERIHGESHQKNRRQIGADQRLLG